MRTHTKNDLALRCRQAGAAVVATATALVTITALAPTAVADTGDTPAYVQQIGGSGRAIAGIAQEFPPPAQRLHILVDDQYPAGGFHEWGTRL